MYFCLILKVASCIQFLGILYCQKITKIGTNLDINELRCEIETFAAKVAVAVSDPEGEKPIEHVRRKRSGPLTLVLFDLTNSVNMSLVVRVQFFKVF